MLVAPILSLAGVYVGGQYYHTDCAPDGPTSPVFEFDHGVDQKECAECTQPLVRFDHEPEPEEVEECLNCGEPADLDSLFCSRYCSQEYSAHAQI